MKGHTLLCKLSGAAHLAQSTPKIKKQTCFTGEGKGRGEEDFFLGLDIYSMEIIQ
jgi:hypothetical protein